MVLTSKHQKLALIAPPLQERFDITLFEVPLDTDLLGTFTGEKERELSQLETAISKARMGIQASGLSFGIGSEGAIGLDSEMPFLNSDLEVLVLVDNQRNIVISEHLRSFEIIAATRTVRPGEDLTDFLQRADFPHHGLIAKTQSEKQLDCVKGITDYAELIQAIESLSQSAADGVVTIESDLRAHYSPSRRENIKKVAELLAIRIEGQCPQCATPGWGKVGYERGLSCSECQLEKAEAIHREILGCVACDFQSLGKIIAETVDPAQCAQCNP